MDENHTNYWCDGHTFLVWNSYLFGMKFIPFLVWVSYRFLVWNSYRFWYAQCKKWNTYFGMNFVPFLQWSNSFNLFICVIGIGCGCANVIPCAKAPKKNPWMLRPRSLDFRSVSRGSMTKLNREGDIQILDGSLLQLGGDRMGGSLLSPVHASPHAIFWSTSSTFL